MNGSGSFTAAVRKALSFPAILCGMMFVCLVVASPIHSIVPAFTFSAVWLALLAVPTIGFAWLRWRSSVSRSFLTAFKGRVRQRITSAYEDNKDR